MNLRTILFMSFIWIAVPMWIGYIWVELLRVQGRLMQLLHAWVLGFATMLAVAQLVLVPMVAMQKPLSQAQYLWEIVMQILACGGFFLLLFRRGERLFATGEEVAVTSHAKSGKPGRYQLLLGTLVVIIILLQAYIPARYQHSDDDDSRFIAEEVAAVEHDTMYQDSPVDADFMYWDVGEVRKDLTSPWAMFVAMQSKISGVAPAILSHTYLPFFLILVCYALYAMIGSWLFAGNAEKVLYFLLFLSVLHLFGYTSTHTMASMLLLRIWQGKAVCASFILPLFFYLFGQIMQHGYRRNWILLLYVASTGACLLSGIGIVTAPVVLFIYGFLDFCYYRQWRKTLAVWGAALPCVIYLGYYLLG